MSAEETLYVKSRAQWRRWLKTRGTKKPEIWLIYYKKHTGQPSIPYDHAVEEAICFGWIDTTVRRIDEERYMQRFTPRRRNSQWSALNRRRAEALLEKGLVAPEGLARIEEARANGRWDAATKEKEAKKRAPVSLPAELKTALCGNEKAKSFFQGLPPAKKRQLMAWVAVAKKRETREKRAGEAVKLLAEGKELGMK